MNCPFGRASSVSLGLEHLELKTLQRGKRYFITYGLTISERYSSTLCGFCSSPLACIMSATACHSPDRSGSSRR